MTRCTMRHTSKSWRRVSILQVCRRTWRSSCIQRRHAARGVGRTICTAAWVARPCYSSTVLPPRSPTPCVVCTATGAPLASLSTRRRRRVAVATACYGYCDCDCYWCCYRQWHCYCYCCPLVALLLLLPLLLALLLLLLLLTARDTATRSWPWLPAPLAACPVCAPC